MSNHSGNSTEGLSQSSSDYTISSDDNGDDGSDNDDNNNNLERLENFDICNTESIYYLILSNEDTHKCLLVNCENFVKLFKVPYCIAQLIMYEMSWNEERAIKSMRLNSLSFFHSVFITPKECRTDPRFNYVTWQDPLRVCNLDEIAVSRCLVDDVCECCCREHKEICSDGMNESVRLWSLLCGKHFVCVDCWESYIRYQICEVGTALRMECLGSDCHVRIPSDFVLKILQSSKQLDETLEKRYKKFIIRDLVESHPCMRFCSKADCEKVFYLPNSKITKLTIIDNTIVPDNPFAKLVISPLSNAPNSAASVDSDLRNLYPSLLIMCSGCDGLECFLCGEEYHAPCTCQTFQAWLKICRDDSETANYISVNTKDCPNCQVCIEKNGGCNHMKCFKCRQDFCWMCLGDWNQHTTEYYECSRYKENPKIFESKLQNARTSLNKYLFYYERWANHDRSIRFENQHRDKIQQRIEFKVNNKDGTWIDWQHLLTAMDTLKRCRSTLKHTYPFAYYMDQNAVNEKQLFEYKQGLLEVEVENLSWKIEQAERPDRGALERIVDVCEKHRKALLLESYCT